MGLVLKLVILRRFFTSFFYEIEVAPTVELLFFLTKSVDAPMVFDPYETKAIDITGWCYCRRDFCVSWLVVVSAGCSDCSNVSRVVFH